MFTDENNIAVESPDTMSTEFYRYAYTELLNRKLVDSCETFLKKADTLQHSIEDTMKAMQEVLYNGTKEQTPDIRYSMEHPQDMLNQCSYVLADAVAEIRKYKTMLISENNK